MAITSERFNQATEVVEQGITAAAAMLKLPIGERPKALEAHSVLTDDLRDGALSQDGLLDLLGVALMVCAYERTSGKSYRDA